MVWERSHVDPSGERKAPIEKEGFHIDEPNLPTSGNGQLENQDNRRPVGGARVLLIIVDTLLHGVGESSNGESCFVTLHLKSLWIGLIFSL